VFRKQLSYANVVASLALFVALGGGAMAAATLPRDSVGRPQIRTDAVNPPEIASDAVRSPEIRAEAVRSSEIQDESIRLADIADGARAALEDATTVRFAEVDSVDVRECVTLATCSSLASVTLGPGNWLVQAKLTLVGSPFGLADRCGLVQGALFDPVVVDEASSLGLDVFIGSDQIALADVVQTSGITTVAARCTEDTDAFLIARDVKLTALQVDSAFGA
jgi:hypothetical protein